MLGGKQEEEEVTDQFAIISIIAAAIRDSRIDNPHTDAGTVRDKIFGGIEEAIPIAKAVTAALDEAGYDIVPKVKPA
jgi:hypothetical protein